jgi:hypothetical protein
MVKNLVVAVFASSLFLVGACEDKKTDAPAPVAVPAAAPAPAAPPAAAPAAAAGGEIGVAECDDYIKKMEACLGKVPAAAKSAMEQSLKASQDAWKTAASTPAGKDALKTSCKAAADAMAANPMCK